MTRDSTMPTAQADARWHQLLGFLSALLIAGVVGGVATFGAVRSLDTNVSLFREEVRREFDWYQSQIQRLQIQIDAHINAHQEPGNS